jgi:FkbM family methyltransferase
MTVNYDDYSSLFLNYKWSIYEEEKPSWDYLQGYLKPGCVFFDIGCQRGIYSKGVIDILGENCSVYGFDILQHPQIIELEKNNVNFKFVHSAIGDGKSLVDCIIHYDSNTKLIEQKTISLDQFCKNNNIEKIDFIKMDVDGSQNSVINGSNYVLSDIKPMLMIEMNSNFGNSVTDSNEYFDQVKDENDLYLFDKLNFYGYSFITVRNGNNAFFMIK